MHNDELERILSSEPEVQASPMFASKVMRAVEREAAGPPPIGFPWKRALPGFAAGILAIGSLLASLSWQGTTQEIPAAWMEVNRHFGLEWLALSFAATALALGVARKLASK